MDIRELESVCAVVKYGNYSEAAYNIASSPSVISKHVAKVERELGIKIFERASKSRTGTLTKEGEQIIGYLNMIVELWHNAHKKASELLMSETEKLAVGYISFIGNYRENEILARFSLENPQVLLYRRAGDTQELIDMLVSGVLDAIMLPIMEGLDTHDSIYTALTDRDIVVEEVLENDVLTIGVPDSHPLAGKDAITREDFHLLHNDVFMFSNNQRERFDHTDLYQLLEFKVEMRRRYVDFSEPTVALKLVEAGKGVLPQACITPRHAGKVTFLPVEGWKKRTILYFIFRKSAYTRALGKLRECVRDFSREMS